MMTVNPWRFLLALALSSAFWCGAARAQSTTPATNPPQPATPQSATPQSQTPQSGTPSEAKPAQQDQNIPQQQQPTIRNSTTLVRMVATVMDRHRSFVTDLDKKDFKILEDGQPQDIQFFVRETDLPLRIGLLLDTSNSIRPRLQFEQDAAVDFLSNVVRRHKDMAFLMTFDNEPEVIQDWSGDLSYLVDAIHKQRAGGGTALNDAIYLASQKLLTPPLPDGQDKDVRRVLVVISDGDDNLSDHAPSEALDAAIRSEIAIYAISTNTQWVSVDDESKPQKYHLDPGDKVLQQFADESGGRVFFPYRVDDLAQSFLDIGNELRSQYFIAYSPANAAATGKFHKIDVQVDRKGLVVRTRKGYYASANAAAAGSSK
jgi:Ca-activated chloride channel family protein